jgi:hypothetical protein
MARSWYLDDMSLTTGDTVLCKANIAAAGITVGNVYTVEARDCGYATLNGVVDDNGHWCIPSARFQYRRAG